MPETGPVCIMGDDRIPLESVIANSKRVASGFAALGVREGDAIAILMRNDVPYLEAVLAASVVGAYAVSINWHFKGDEIRYILEDCGAKVLVVHSDLHAVTRDSVPEGVRVVVAPTPDIIREAYNVPMQDTDLAENVVSWTEWTASLDPWTKPSRRAPGTMTYTSGTTGKPKGVKRKSHDRNGQARMAELIREWFRFRDGMSTIISGPLYHSVIATYTFAALRANATIVLMPRFSEAALLETIEREKITHLHLVPTMFVRLLRLPDDVRMKYDLSSLEMVVHGASPCPIDVKRQIIDWFGPVVYEYYGATEFGMVTRCDSNEWLEKPGTTGRAWPGRRIEILDENGNNLGSGESGEVYVSLGAVADFTYHNHEDERRGIDRGGLISVGDAGYLDEDGYLFLTDRKRDMIISGGVNIYPAEIEAAIASHPDITDSAVFGVPDQEYGEQVLAIIQPAIGRTVDQGELVAFLKERLANYKIPRLFESTNQLPRDDAGKIRKRLLRDPYWEGHERRI